VKSADDLNIVAHTLHTRAQGHKHILSRLRPHQAVVRITIVRAVSWLPPHNYCLSLLSEDMQVFLTI